MSRSPDIDSYDFVIIGAGSAGCVLAARLSAHAVNRVLLVEAGKDYAPGHEPSEILDIFAATAYAKQQFIWPNVTAKFGPRPGNAPDRRPRRLYNQGRVIGGTSSINGMAALRGLPSDYDGWAERGAVGWKWQDVLPYFKRLEADRDFDGPLHNKSGPIHVQRYAPAQWPGFTRGVVTAIGNQGWQDIADQNGVFADGYAPVAHSHTDHRRMGAAWSYLTAEVRRRPNLVIMGEVDVERILFEGGRAAGIRGRRGTDHFEVRAREVIVSGGALQSPALLLRSGIGPARELAPLGIAVVADRAGVGKHLMEHPGVNFGCFLKPDARLPRSIRRQMFVGLRWSSEFEGCPPGDMYLIPSNKAQWHAIGERLGLMMLWVNRSFSTGELKLTSPDRASPLDIDFNMCSDARDLERLMIGVRLMHRLQADPAVQDTVEQVFPVSYSDWARALSVHSRANAAQTFIGATLMDSSAALRRWMIDKLIADAPSIEDLAHDDGACRDWIKTAVVGHWHASCTCRMGAADDAGAVTDPAARVYGVEGLRVCDASIMPTVPCANTNIPTIMIGEKVAATILAGA
ncbi:MAG: GMC family oxidoreductase N-terminal domain-containing protein [Xanthobacteraceae bacterium]|nr:GMC family oxidoreductase N-terminal domain-containing protein [Xanthobacteraceae bacterium]